MVTAFIGISATSEVAKLASTEGIRHIAGSALGRCHATQVVEKTVFLKKLARVLGPEYRSLYACLLHLLLFYRC